MVWYMDTIRILINGGYLIQYESAMALKRRVENLRGYKSVALTKPIL